MKLKPKRKAQIIRSLQGLILNEEAMHKVKDIAKRINIDLKSFFKLTQSVLGELESDSEVTNEKVKSLLLSLKGTGTIPKEEAEKMSKKRVRYKLVQQEKSTNKKNFPKKTKKQKNYEDFLSLTFADDKSLLTSINKLKFIKNENIIHDIFQKIAPHLNEFNSTQCYNSLLKKINIPRQKIYFSDIFTEYLDRAGIQYNDSIHVKVGKIERSIQDSKAKRRWRNSMKMSKAASVKKSGNAVSNVYGSPGNYSKLIFNLPRS